MQSIYMVHRMCNKMLIPSPPRPHHGPPAGAGAFAWRYLDLVDPAGDGVVLIWGWALPFLAPDPAGAASGAPNLNFIAYRGGIAVFYHLQVFDPSEVRPEGAGWRFGPNLLQSECIGDRWRVRADLDLPIAGQSEGAKALVTLDGPAAFGHLHGTGPHRWSILSAVADATAEIRLPGGASLSFRGRGYHDENESDRPLSALGIDEWTWGRIAEPRRDLVHYRCTGSGEPVGLHVGVAESGALTFEALGAMPGTGRIGGTWGHHAPATIEVHDQLIQAGPVVDDSSFYIRFSLRSATGLGWGESVRPAAIESWWMRRLVPLCVTTPRAPSFLLPMFSGPRTNRVQRTLAWWMR